MKKENRARKAVLILLAVCLVIGVVCVARGIWENGALQTEYIAVESLRLPEAFDGYTVAHISDLHGAQFGEDNAELLQVIRTGEPDLIAITGDLIDIAGDINTAISFAEQAVQIAPTYYVTGNHEARLSDLSPLVDGLSAVGVTVLTDERVRVEREGDSILVGGLADPGFPDKRDVDSRIAQMAEREDEFLLVLSHRPELFDYYVEYGIDLSLCGHAHGGQFRLPFVGGLVAPGQGLFPKYDNGLYQENGASMIVSRGIGNSVFPFRLGNRPHVIFAELKNS